MIRYPLTNNTLPICKLIDKDPVFFNIFGKFFICQNSLVIPTECFSDLCKLDILLKSGAIGKCFNCGGKLKCERLN